MASIFIIKMSKNNHKYTVQIIQFFLEEIQIIYGNSLFFF